MIEILLPVYNGEKYLAEQIDSIIAQTNQDWVLKIRNDGSKDNSQKIIDSYCQRYPDKIIEIVSPKENVGLVQSLNLLYKSEPHGEYIAFSDQDDVWLPDKLDRTLERIKELEANNDEIPIGACTDARCVDEKLEVLSYSFFKSQKFPSGILGNTHKMVALNIVQGSTLMINRNAASISFPLPKILNVHDAWIAILINNYGIIEYIKWQSMLYRQHNNNVLGEIKIGLSYYLNRAKKTFSTIRFLRDLQKDLPFKINIFLILYYKLRFGIKRIL